jgi:hypothetical protein
VSVGRARVDRLFVDPVEGVGIRWARPAVREQANPQTWMSSPVRLRVMIALA